MFESMYSIKEQDEVKDCATIALYYINLGNSNIGFPKLM